MVMIDMNDNGSWYEQLRVVYDIIDLGYLAQGSKCYEQLNIVVDMKNLGSWSQGSRIYE